MEEPDCALGTTAKMTVNLLTSVPEGMVLLADSMMTMQNITTNGALTTTFPNAQKLVELGSSLPAAAMVSGQGVLAGDVMSVILKRATAFLDSQDFQNDAAGVVAAVTAAIDPCYQAAAAQFRAELAAFWSQPERLGEVNADRAARGLAATTVVDPGRVRIDNDPAGPIDPADWDVHGDFTLNVVVASYFVDPQAVAIEWPGARQSSVVPGPSPLWWWGSGGSSVSRLVRGLDLSVIQRLAALNDPDAPDLLRIVTSRPEFLMPTPVGAMPLQDAIEFTEYLGIVSCGFERFTAGPPAVGGPLDVIVLQHGSREWVRRKRIHSSILER